VDWLQTVAVHPSGRSGHLELIDRADLVTEMRTVTQPTKRSIDGLQGSGF
jgi:ATP:corrinoid adenosyltransferase